ncbi:MAG: hypothetical protein BRC57_04965 [Cyanobacteria bacterium QS_8_48_54]|nr:MAG: hypothetical protein BRC57_04965 [Cyanobacteria bacterium QS_8_48_54]
MQSGKQYEQNVQAFTGRTSQIIEGREIDSVTDEALIQAKDSETATIFLQDIQSEYPQNTKLWLYLQGWCWQNNRINWRRYFLWSRCCSR